MITNKMKYKNFTFDYNPKQINIDNRKNLVEIKLPFLGSVVQDLGREKRVVTGNGEFFGENCIEKFNELSNLSLENKSGLLFIPGIEPFKAFFKSLKMTADPMPNLISYSFEFWEDTAAETVEFKNLSPTYHVVLQGETLWDIARKYNTTAYNLITLNPDIKRPNMLLVGQKVMLV